MPDALSIDELATIIRPVAEQYGVARAYVFGPYARGDADEDSFVNIMIVSGRLRGMALGGF